MIEIIKADIPDVSNELDLKYDGTRAIDGGAPEFREGIMHPVAQAIKFRCFITKKNAVQSFQL